MKNSKSSEKVGKNQKNLNCREKVIKHHITFWIISNHFPPLTVQNFQFYFTAGCEENIGVRKNNIF